MEYFFTKITKSMKYTQRINKNFKVTLCHVQSFVIYPIITGLVIRK